MNVRRKKMNTVLQGYWANFSIYEKIEFRAIGSTYKISQITLLVLQKISILALFIFVFSFEDHFSSLKNKLNRLHAGLVLMILKRILKWTPISTQKLIRFSAAVFSVLALTFFYK